MKLCLRLIVPAALALGATAAGAAPAGPAEQPLKLAAVSTRDMTAATGTAMPLELGQLDLARPDGAEAVRVSYEVYIGGLHIISAELAAVVDHGKYVAASQVTTKGLAEVFANSTIQAISTGAVRDRLVVPSTYNSDTLSTGKRQLVGVTFGSDGLPKGVDSKPAYDLTRYPISTDLKRDTVDPMSAALFITMGSSANDAQKCGQIVPIFDGRRRYNLSFTYKKDENVSLGRDFNGGKPLAAHLCEARYVRVAGFKQKELNKSGDVPPLNVWLAPIPGTDFQVPVRMQATSDFGGIVSRAVKLTVQPASSPG